MINNELFLNMINAPVRALRGRVEVYEGSTLSLLCGCHDNLKNFTIERVGAEGKFFGYGICQKLNVHLLDKDRAINISTANTLEVEFGVDNNYIYPFPNFYVTEVNRDEETNELSITAYDAIYNAASHTVSELILPSGYTILKFAAACATLLGLPIAIENVSDNVFNTEYAEGANFEGSETIREALDAIAEATQTIYYINSKWELVFKRLDREGAAALEITKDKYFSLDSGDNRRLANITHATELGDNVEAKLSVNGSTQYVRDNPFWELRDDIGDIVEAALANIGGLTINQFSCSWRGNYLLEIGDKIALTTKDNNTVVSYLLNDTLSFDGSLSQSTEWSYKEDNTESAANPSNLGEALKQTFARVDKQNKQIELLASDISANSENISNLQLSTNGINAYVHSMETKNEDAISGLNEDIATLTNKVNASITSEQVKLEIQSELANGVTKVETSTGFTFNDEGLTVSKSGSEMSTQITEDGMQVFKDNTAVLTANNEGVDAVNLKASTYLIIGHNSRLEDYDGSRTGCFWIGGYN